MEIAGFCEYSYFWLDDDDVVCSLCFFRRLVLQVLAFFVVVERKKRKEETTLFFVIDRSSIDGVVTLLFQGSCRSFRERSRSSFVNEKAACVEDDKSTPDGPFSPTMR